jgi:hypothetical protein
MLSFWGASQLGTICITQGEANTAPGKKVNKAVLYKHLCKAIIHSDFFQFQWLTFLQKVRVYVRRVFSETNSDIGCNSVRFFTCLAFLG